jgi:hypothetical protein
VRVCANKFQISNSRFQITEIIDLEFEI